MSHIAVWLLRLVISTQILLNALIISDAMLIKPVTTRIPYTPPSWARNVLTNPPSNGRLQLANLPTPIHELIAHKNGSICSNSDGCDIMTTFFHNKNNRFYIKRDDATGGVELGGNKVRKLEFLLSDALARGKDCVVTIGGEQSNHCRATSSASRMIGLEPHLILRTKKKNKSLGFVGNVLFDRMVGSQIFTVTPGEYGRFGSDDLVSRVCNNLEESGKCPYGIPVGGSNGLGTWGYIQAVEETLTQLDGTGEEGKLDHVVFATGSGGTATGIILGMALAFEARGQKVPKMHAIGVCDDEEYFYKKMASIAEEMGFVHPSNQQAEHFIRKHVAVHQGKGKGYAMNTRKELEFVTQFALDTGVVLDPVYSGKALYHFVTEVMVKEKIEKSNILFWHTGGALGMYDKGESLPLNQISPVIPMDPYTKQK